MTSRRILPVEWGALFLLALTAACLAILARNPFFALPVGLVWLAVAGALIVSGVIIAVRDPLGPADRIRSAIAAPLAIGIAWSAVGFHPA